MKGYHVIEHHRYPRETLHIHERKSRLYVRDYMKQTPELASPIYTDTRTKNAIGLTQVRSHFLR